MKLFTRLYDAMIRAAGHRHAPWYLGAVSVAESSFFPIPPDVMLMPMVLAEPRRAWQLATLTTLCSVLGGVLGYALGYFAIDAALPLIEQAGYGQTWLQVQALYREWGIWIVFLAGFSPIPYKLFTIASGFMAMPLLPFILASLIGRGGRFYLEALLVSRLGPRVQDTVRRFMEWIGWGLVGSTALIYLFH
ncbi:MAG: YqaA family protein [Candidatus Macondimonas sp.]